MNTIRRKLILDVYDYAGNKICPIYDSFSDVIGQAYNVVVATQRNGSKVLSFNLPMTCQTQNGQQDNFRLQYIKADFKILLQDDRGKDWYLITSPKSSHNGLKKSISVTANHISQLLKYKQLSLQFSDKQGNNVGAINELVTTVLEGTGWTLGTCAHFYQDDTYNIGKQDSSKIIKIRSITASTKTGAFKLIANICQKFNAKPVYNGWDKTVDILPLNPFKMEQDQIIPQLNKEITNGVIQIHYGHNMKSVQRTLNTDNIVTRLYVYGAFGQDYLKYLDISMCQHDEYEFYNMQMMEAHKTYYIKIYRDFGDIMYVSMTPRQNVQIGCQLHYSLMDQASKMYVWNETTGRAIPARIGMKGDPVNIQVKFDSTGFFKTDVSELDGTDVLYDDGK